MRTALSLAFVGFVLAACTIDSDKMNNKDAMKAYVAPTLCLKQQNCAPIAFTLTYSTEASLNAEGDERSRLERIECERIANETEQKKETELTDCTNEDYQKCRADYLQVSCPADESAKGLPPLPPSCTKC